MLISPIYKDASSKVGRALTLSADGSAAERFGEGRLRAEGSAADKAGDGCCWLLGGVERILAVLVVMMILLAARSAEDSGDGVGR